MHAIKYLELYVAVYKWYEQEHSVSVSIRGVDIQSAVLRLVSQIGMSDFKASAGRLFKFCTSHNCVNRKVVRESRSADLSEIERFRKRLNNLISESGLLLSQVYNTDTHLATKWPKIACQL